MERISKDIQKLNESYGKRKLDTSSPYRTNYHIKFNISTHKYIYFSGNIVAKINDSGEKSLEQKKELESLNITDFSADNFICDTSIADTVQKIITIRNKIIIALNDLKGITFFVF